MEKKLVFESRFHKPYIYSKVRDDVENILQVQFKPSEKFTSSDAGTKSVDFCIVLDVSGSMQEPFTSGSTQKKIDAAIQAAKKVYDFIGPSDTISIVFYSDKVHTILDKGTNIRRDEYERLIDTARNYSGATNITLGLRRGKEILHLGKGTIKRIIFLTDGLPTEDTEEDGLREASDIAEKKITINALGVGNDFNYVYIEKLAQKTRGTTYHMKSLDDAVKIFEEVFQSAKNTIVKNVTAKFKFSERVRVKDFYRALPETTYMGKLELGKDRLLEVDLGDVELGKVYEYLFEVAIPKPVTEYQGPFKAGEVTLEYELTATGERISDKKDLIVELTGDIEKTYSEYASVYESYIKCQINKLDMLMNEKLKVGDGKTAKDLINEIIKKADEIGDYNLKEMYENMLEELIRTGKISQKYLIVASNQTTRINNQAVGSNQEVNVDEIFG
ncbi:MAG: VWA domain-containing protein [Fervidobacterium sp.]|uniref:vWA domain-containing protein n=1 Tax=Fervidobacterium sp. TaxID=1871331 RepID=UPI0022044498|nr:hypothetical protein IB67_01300 [Fervidobacterium riparium]